MIPEWYKYHTIHTTQLRNRTGCIINTTPRRCPPPASQRRRQTDDGIVRRGAPANRYINTRLEKRTPLHLHLHLHFHHIQGDTSKARITAIPRQSTSPTKSQSQTQTPAPQIPRAFTHPSPLKSPTPDTSAARPHSRSCSASNRRALGEHGYGTAWWSGASMSASSISSSTWSCASAGVGRPTERPIDVDDGAIECEVGTFQSAVHVRY